MFEILNSIKSYFKSGNRYDSYKIKEKIRSGDFEEAFADLKACSNAGALVNRDNILYDAIRYGDANLVKNILSLDGVDVNQKTYAARTPIMIAIDEKKNDIFKVLLEVEGVDVNCSSYFGFKPIHVLIIRDNFEAFNSLIAKEGLDVNAKMDDGVAPLDLATAFYKKNPEFLKSLITIKGIDLNSITKNGKTAVEIAAYQGNDELVQLLKNAGASMSPLDNFKEEMVSHTNIDMEYAPELQSTAIPAQDDLSTL